MKDKLSILKLSLLAGSVAAFAVGCASSGYAHYDRDADRHGMGVSASTEVGTDRYNTVIVDKDAEKEAYQTVSALSFSPVTSATDVNKFPFYDWNLKSIDLYTFAVPNPDMKVKVRSDLPEFSVNLPPGSVYVESAGGRGEVRAGEIIEHSPNPGMPTR
jgi:hypothetical protein